MVVMPFPTNPNSCLGHSEPASARQGNGKKMGNAEFFIGVDVSKKFLDICVLPDGSSTRVENNPKGFERLVQQLDRYRNSLVVMEATGGFESPACAALWGAGFKVSIVNPRHVRSFAKALGILAKTEAYRYICEKEAARPLTQRRFSDMISYLDLYGLVNARVISKGRYGNTRDIPSVLPVEVVKRLISGSGLFNMAFDQHGYLE